MDKDERRLVELALRRFAARVESVLFGREGPDGDLDRIPGLVAEAQALDLIADPRLGMAGFELGVWGRDCLTEGAERSLLTRAILGESCAGLAAAVHAQGLGCLARRDVRLHQIYERTNQINALAFVAWLSDEP